MTVNITREDITTVFNYIENGRLVEHMNNAGLSYNAMALILTAISNECEKILDAIDKEENNVN